MTLGDLGIKPPSVARYKQALLAVQWDMKGRQPNLLPAHYYAPDRTVTATTLAGAVGYKGWQGANLQYGILASMVCQFLGLDLPYYVAVFATFDAALGREHWELAWVMIPQLAQALEELRWVKPKPL